MERIAKIGNISFIGTIYLKGKTFLGISFIPGIDFTFVNYQYDAFENEFSIKYIELSFYWLCFRFSIRYKFN